MNTRATKATPLLALLLGSSIDHSMSTPALRARHVMTPMPPEFWEDVKRARDKAKAKRSKKGLKRMEAQKRGGFAK